ncbi:MAG: hypothetical protein J6Z43_08980 [Clostridiales bacterium]|nr:hypothetical protein [Clostridiales bacterium]
MNRNQLKYIAIISMIVDHIGMFLLSDGLAGASASQIVLYALCRTIGRLTGPIMLFFLTEGYVHTSSKVRYAIRLFAFGIISQIPYALSHYNTLMVADLNVIITLFVTFLMLSAEENIKNRVIRRIVVFALIMATFCCDWGVIGPFMAWLFYMYRNDRNTQVKAYVLISAVQVISAVVFLIGKGFHWYGELWQAGMFLVIPLLLRYNGQPGSRHPVHKWIFYIIYPLHFLVFWFICS